MRVWWDLRWKIAVSVYVGAAIVVTHGFGWLNRRAL